MELQALKAIHQEELLLGRTPMAHIIQDQCQWQAGTGNTSTWAL